MVKWFIETFESPNFLLDALKRQGEDVVECPLIWSYDIDQYLRRMTDDSFFHGTCQTAERLRRKGFKNLLIDQMGFAAIVHQSFVWQQSRHYINSSFHAIPQEYSKLPHQIFVKPLQQQKLFTGQIVSSRLLASFMAENNITSRSDMVWAPVKYIEEEWRFIVFKNKVITGSQYQKDHQLYMRSEFPEDAADLAQIVSWNLNVPILAVIDICFSEGKYWLLEMNSINTSGLYLCDPKPIIAAIKELVGDA